MERAERLRALGLQDGQKVGAMLFIPRTHLEVAGCTSALARQALNAAFGDGRYTLSVAGLDSPIVRDLTGCALVVSEFTFCAGVSEFWKLASQVDEAVS